MPFCPYCGSEVEKALYCPNCGKPQGGIETPSPPQYYPPRSTGRRYDSGVCLFVCCCLSPAAALIYYLLTEHEDNIRNPPIPRDYLIG